MKTKPNGQWRRSEWARHRLPLFIMHILFAYYANEMRGVHL